MTSAASPIASVTDDHPVDFDVAMRTAEVLAAAMPPVDLTALANDPALRRLEELVGPDVRIAILRARAGDWEVRPFDPDRPARFELIEAGRGETPTAAIQAVLEQLLD